MKWLLILIASLPVFASGVMSDSEHQADAREVYYAMIAVGMYPNVAVYAGDYYVAFVGEDFYVLNEDCIMEVAAAIFATGRVSAEAPWTSGMLYIGYENWSLYIPTWRCRTICGFMDAGTYSEDYVLDYIREYTQMEPR